MQFTSFLFSPAHMASRPCSQPLITWKATQCTKCRPVMYQPFPHLTRAQCKGERFSPGLTNVNSAQNVAGTWVWSCQTPFRPAGCQCSACEGCLPFSTSPARSSPFEYSRAKNYQATALEVTLLSPLRLHAIKSASRTRILEIYRDSGGSVVYSLAF